jgi:hypothetical protein
MRGVKETGAHPPPIHRWRQWQGAVLLLLHWWQQPSSLPKRAPGRAWLQGGESLGKGVLAAGKQQLQMWRVQPQRHPRCAL